MMPIHPDQQEAFEFPAPTLEASAVLFDLIVCVTCGKPFLNCECRSDAD